MDVSRTDCARARESVSADLDGELPELELEWQRAHLRLCPDCAAWAERVQEQTHLLREALLEEPVAGFALPRYGRRWRVNPAFAVASVAAVAASIVVGLGPQRAAVGGRAGRHQSTAGSLSMSNVADPLSASSRISIDSLVGRLSAPVGLLGKFRAV